ncbi:hypothetical protein K2Z84_33710 [Candidatus Binatia bacterium]|nr:hypothetical protein [Candidatus Binatia bacterium]
MLARNATSFFRPWLDPAAHGTVAVALSAAWFVALGGLALRGTASLWTRDRTLVILLVASVLLAGFAHVPFQTVLRFRLPFTEPLLLALAAAGALASSDRRVTRDAVQGDGRGERSGLSSTPCA